MKQLAIAVLEQQHQSSAHPRASGWLRDEFFLSWLLPNYPPSQTMVLRARGINIYHSRSHSFLDLQDHTSHLPFFFWEIRFWVRTLSKLKKLLGKEHLFLQRLNASLKPQASESATLAHIGKEEPHLMEVIVLVWCASHWSHVKPNHKLPCFPLPLLVCFLWTSRMDELAPQTPKATSHHLIIVTQTWTYSVSLCSCIEQIL